MWPANKVRRTGTNRSMIGDATFGIGSACRLAFARVTALVADAGQMIRTLLVGTTTQLTTVTDADFAIVTLRI